MITHNLNNTKMFQSGSDYYISGSVISMQNKTNNFTNTNSFNGNVSFGKNTQYPIQSLTVSGSVLNNNQHTIVCYGDGVNPFTVLLPSLVTHGTIYTIKHFDSVFGGTLTIDGNGRNIDDNSDVTINSIYGSITVQYDSISNSWYIIGEYVP